EGKSRGDKRLSDIIKSPRKLTFSAGVVIANAHNAIYYLEKVATQLLKKAKSSAKELRQKGREESVVDFSVLTTSKTIGSNVEQDRRDHYETTSLYDPIRLTFRPYSLEQIEALVEETKKLKSRGFPRSQLYILRQGLTEGRAVGNNLLNYQLTRMEEDHREALIGFLNRLCPRTPNKIDFWREDPDDRHATPLIDLVEIYDYVREN
ncbi:MAG: hypothetical protein L0Y56_12700, partial [Nitrospira sp.]|nr:hypothetical protein [Nitrospira sp.]